MNLIQLKSAIEIGDLDENLSAIYTSDKQILKKQKDRYLKLINTFESTFQGKDSILLCSAPGRTELGGNHTDHQNGNVIAAGVNLDMIACCSPNSENSIRIKSEGFDMVIVELSHLYPLDAEINTSAALIRGIASRISEMGYSIKGFDACITSDVLTGSGLSSSAAYEVLIGVIINHMYCNGRISAVEIAKIGQYAENVFFKKPCGLMDQMASSVGNIVAIDFKDTEKPIVEKVNFDFNSAGYALCIIDTGGDHSDLTDEYSAIPYEMKQVAAFFEKKALREVDESKFYTKLHEIRKLTGDRALLRAIHYFDDNNRAILQSNALKANNWDEFLKLSNESGHSSYEFLQNVFVPSHPHIQNVSLSLAVCKHLLNGQGSYRVHGGGFAGTIQAFVPLLILDNFKKNIEMSIGENCCHVLSIRPYGGINVLNLPN